MSHRVAANYPCDVHVHVGRADEALLRLETMKRLATMLWLSEDVTRGRRITRMCSPGRRR